MTDRTSRWIFSGVLSIFGRGICGLLLSVMVCSGCEAPRVVEPDTDHVSGQWELSIQGPPEQADRKFKFSVRLELLDDRVTGVSIPLDEENKFLQTDLRGISIGNMIEFDSFLRPDPGRVHGLHAGKFSGVISADGTRITGEVLLDPSFNYRRDWSAQKISR